MGLAAVVVACGKDNKKGGDAIAVPVTNPVFTNNAQVSADYNSFLSRVDNGQFGSSYGSTFRYAQLNTGSNSSNCTTKWGIFNFCSYSSSSSYSTAQTFDRNYYSFSGATTHELGTNITEVHNNLKNLVRNIKDFKIGTGYGQIYYVMTNDNIVYAIDFNQPLVANPVYQQKTDGTGYTFIGIAY